VFSIVASKLGLKEKAYRYFGDSAKMDLLNTHKNTKDGIHAANMGGCYMAIVNGFAMLRAEEEKLILAPSLPKAWEGYRFRIRYHGSLLEISVGKRTCRIERMEGAAVPVELYGQQYVLDEKNSVVEVACKEK
ncbi:MAG: family 65 glycosyl hydrolase, partial [Lachnospiraceae bacterium]|nr:family 65 glycosyl hydrolase [Lachnospiraceae bacterium]